MLISVSLRVATAALIVARSTFAIPEHVVRNEDTQRKTASPYLNEKTKEFLIDSANFPHIPFDFGESYAGRISVSSKPDDEQKLFFWFSPSENPKASDEITVWFNGGPGCSSLVGLFRENGNFQWYSGLDEPVKNPWAWSKLTNMVWVEQPIGVGFTTGNVTAKGEHDLAKQFAGFWKNFVDTFNMTHRKVYLTGESYAGYYIPYIANEMLTRNDTAYYNVQGTMIIDPILSYNIVAFELPSLEFAEKFQPILALNESTRALIRKEHASRHWTSFYKEHFTFPPKGPMPIEPGLSDPFSLWSIIAEAAELMNTCFNVYRVTDSCPILYSAMSQFYPDSSPNRHLGGFLNLTEVKKALHLPNDVEWTTCANNNVFATPDGSDSSAPPAHTVLPKVFDKVPINIVVSGNLDYILMTNGTLFALQNVTWRGGQGFSEYPTKKLVVPTANLTLPNTRVGYYPNPGTEGESGTWVYERNVAFVSLARAGHMVPQHDPSASFRILEVMLGRVGSVEKGLGGGAPWTVPVGVPSAPKAQMDELSAQLDEQSTGGSLGIPTRESPLMRYRPR